MTHFDMTTEDFVRSQQKAESEDDFQERVIELAHTFGWHVAHFRKVQTHDRNGNPRWLTPVAADGEGFVDLVLVRDRVLFVELKAENGTLDPRQRIWRDKLTHADAWHFVWKPRDWDAIERTLR